MSDNSQTTNGSAEPQIEVTDDPGGLIANFISGRTCATQAWCLANVASASPGTHVIVGTLAGVAVSCERLPGKGDYPPYVKLKGNFMATSALTGEVTQAPWAILPGKAAGDMAEVAFTGDDDHPPATRLMLDLEIGVQATAKAPPYRWTVRTHDIDRSEAQKVVEAIRARQVAREVRAGQKAIAHEVPAPKADNA